MTLAARPPPPTPYEEHRATVLGVLAGRCAFLDPLDRKAAFHDAYLTLVQKHRDGALDMEAMHPREVRAYLCEAAIWSCLAELRRADNRLTVPLTDGETSRPDPAAGPEEQTEARLEGAPLRELVEQLPQRRAAVVKLRFYLDLSPTQIQRLLRISPRIYRKELERAFGELARRYEAVREGRFCEIRRSVVVAYVAGVAGRAGRRRRACILILAPPARGWPSSCVRRRSGRRRSSLFQAWHGRTARRPASARRPRSCATSSPTWS